MTYVHVTAFRPVVRMCVPQLWLLLLLLLLLLLQCDI
jgi:hypothetical protein